MIDLDRINRMNKSATLSKEEFVDYLEGQYRRKEKSLYENWERLVNISRKNGIRDGYKNGFFMGVITGASVLMVIIGILFAFNHL